MRLGTLVTSPNFRHPVTLAKDLITLDDVSDGRITLGIGAGGNGFDATALGQDPWSPRERADRLAEFVPLLDRLLTEDAVTHEAPSTPPTRPATSPAVCRGRGCLSRSPPPGPGACALLPGTVRRG